MSTIKAQVIEGMSGDPLPGATAQLVNANGVGLGQGVYADNNGKFALTSDKLQGNYLLVSYTGLKPVMVATDTLNATDYKEIDLFATDLEAVIVTPGKTRDLLLLALGIGLAVTVVVAKRKKKKYAR